ncbi:RNA polymerase sigma factor [Lutibacter sp. HS1-25]|uniref:RNA polymerase sigma factor n=1 Tax=Lutibacter sp. HS1-25 TaxID=2485000 RepID=UPI0010127EF7|nr:RNA polymerase sigma factor [Lutibacter sp. HS1-25]RXP64449.1 RNA polymerase sigma factor [Lutibacter sp. HS1-25]
MKNESEFIGKLLSANQRDEAFKKLLDLYQKRLYWHIRKIVITHENADDVLQNTFLRVYKSLPNFQQKSTLSTWMFRIAYNESLRFLEQNKNKYYDSVEEVQQKYLNNLVSDSYFEGDEVQLKLHRVLAQLPEKERQIFQMKYYDDLKFREIAEITEIAEGTIKTLYYKSVGFIEKQMLDAELLVKN